MGLKMHEGVSPWNVIAFLLSSFACIMQLNMIATFTSFLLDDNFNITDDEAAETLGNLGLAGDIASVSSEIALGTLMDLMGRKVLSISGLAIAGIGTLISPLPKQIYGLYIIRCVIDIGVIPMLWTPFSVDYIQKESLGLLTVYATLVTQVANLMGSSVSVQIERAIGVDSVYYIYGSLVLLICLILCFGLKEVNKEQLKKKEVEEEEGDTKKLIEKEAKPEEDSQDTGEPESKCDKLKKILQQFKESI